MKKITQGELNDLASKIASRKKKYLHDAPISPLTQSLHISNVIYAPGVSLDIYETLLMVMICSKSKLVYKNKLTYIESIPISENDIINACDLLTYEDKSNRRKKLKKSLQSLIKKNLFIRESVIGDEYHIYKQTMVTNESILESDSLANIKGTEYGKRHSYTSFYFEDILKIILLDGDKFKYSDKLKMIALYISFCYHARDYYHQNNIIKDKRLTNKPVVFESLQKIKDRAINLGVSSGRHENSSTQLMHELMKANVIAYYLVIHKSSKYPTYVMSRYPDGIILEQYINNQMIKESIKAIIENESEVNEMSDKGKIEKEEIQLDEEDINDLFTDNFAQEDNSFIDEMDKKLMETLGDLE